jgi:hypothetical protein
VLEKLKESSRWSTITVTPVNGDIRLGVQPLGEIQFEDQRNDKRKVFNPLTMEQVKKKLK